MAKALSLIIPTFNRLRTIKAILKALESQTLPPGDFEIIAVDDGSTDGTLEMLQGYRGPLNLKLETTGLPPEVYGYHTAINRGIALSHGKYLVFMDSDMVPRHDALEEFLKAHSRWEERGEKVLIRAWWTRRRHPLKMWLKGTSLSRYSPTRALKKDKKFQKLYKKRENLRPKDAPSAFLSVRRDLAVAVDGFPAHAQCYGMDYEFQKRLVDLEGVRIVFEPSIYAIHGPLPGDVEAEAYRWTRQLRDRYIKEGWKGLRSSGRFGKGP